MSPHLALMAARRDAPEVRLMKYTWPATRLDRGARLPAPPAAPGRTRSEWPGELRANLGARANVGVSAGAGDAGDEEASPGKPQPAEGWRVRFT